LYSSILITAGTTSYSGYPDPKEFPNIDEKFKNSSKNLGSRKNSKSNSCEPQNPPQQQILH